MVEQNGRPVQTSSSTPPLHQAAHKEDLATMRELIAGGADVHAAYKGGATALHFAADKGKVRSATFRHTIPRSATFLWQHRE